MSKLHIFNSYTREKEEFVPITPAKAGEPQHVGMYVCGPTVYNDAHLGNCRTFLAFDVIYRYLLHLGYKVRYVRNITDVGHLVDDVDTGGASKIDERARLERLEPMEIVQKYTNGFHDVMRTLNALPPSIEPTATAHLIEQIDMVQRIIDNGYGYVINGSVYFDTQKLIRERSDYGQLSGKRVEELLEETRDNLKKQDEKRNPSDFAIWVKADANHLMRWNSPWSIGFPGWHLECSAMSTKYLGTQFDIHGGGIDLQFPHHENEIAQNVGACGCLPVKYWLHSNLVLLNGRKMSKSTGHNVMPNELFTGSNGFFAKPFSPMVFRLLTLQTHYRSTLDLTAKGLEDAEQAYHRLMAAYATLQTLRQKSPTTQPTDEDTAVRGSLDSLHEAMNNDFNTAIALSHIFGLVSKINAFANNQLSIDLLQADTFQRLQTTVRTFLFDIFGLVDETQTSATSKDGEMLDAALQLILDMRQEARARKDFATSDLIRNRLQEAGIQIKDGKGGATWEKL